MTPEAKMKRAIRAVLNKYGEHIYVFMPVQGGYGKPALDYMCFVCSRALAVEAKRIGGHPTPRQEMTIDAMEQAGAKVFIVNDYEKLEELDQWIATVVEDHVRNR
jgi:hypothetical protein